MNLSELFPEIDRYWSTEMTPTRLALGAATSVLIGICLLAAASASPDPGATLYVSTLAIQAILLLGYGTARATGTILNERVDRTWDLQRLTPLSSLEISLGKLLGAPLFAYFLAACFVPWTFAAYLMATNSPGLPLGWSYALLVSGAFCLLCAGLLVSAYAEKTVVGSSPTTAAYLMAFFGLQLAAPLFSVFRESRALAYFGVSVSPRLFGVLTALSFGLWALSAARWRVGRDLLEPRRFWRLPAFLVFVTVYQVGFSTSDTSFAMAVPAFFCYFVGVLNAENLEHWKRWSLSSGDEWWDEMPGWIAACGTCLMLTALLAFFRRPQPGWEGIAMGRYPLLQVLFVIRDLCFVQWCRFTRSRRPELMAVIFIGLAYALPGIMLGAFHLGSEMFWFYPIPQKDVAGLANVLPALAQAAGAVAWLVIGWRDARRA